MIDNREADNSDPQYVTHHICECHAAKLANLATRLERTERERDEALGGNHYYELAKELRATKDAWTREKESLLRLSAELAEARESESKLIRSNLKMIQSGMESLTMIGYLRGGLKGIAEHPSPAEAEDIREAAREVLGGADAFQ